MDTRFWGPSGWRLLHLITFAYNPKTDKACIEELFNDLPFVLPCKYCRKSLSEYMEKYDLHDSLKSQASLSRWLWNIHNEVNAKLRSQNLPVEKDPPFNQIKEYYQSLLSNGCSRTDFPGWEFLFSVAELHPLSKSARKSVPMPGAPPCDSIQTIEEKNKWNCLKPEERIPIYNRFWKSLGNALPFKEWRESWLRHSNHGSKDTRVSTIKWLWKIRCNMESDLELLNKCKYSSLCRNLTRHKSDCNKKAKGKTCRKRRR